MRTSHELTARMAEGYIPSVPELAGLLGEEDSGLLQAADTVRQAQVGDTVQIRGILEFSNYCRRHCAYCGLNVENRGVQRYRLPPEAMITAILEAAEAGYRTIVLQSGEDPWYTASIMCEIIYTVKEKRPGLRITLSLGERPYSELQAMREAGADRYLLKHETACSGLYRKLHPDSNLEARVSCLRNIKELGYETGSGFMVGLPGQTLETLAQDLLLLREIGCHMAGIGPFIPHPETTLKTASAGSPTLTQRCVAAARLLLPKANLPATTSLGVLSPDGRDQVFSGGANVIMRKVTPWSCRRLYEIYPANLGPEEDLITARKKLEEYIRGIGKEPC